jgi:extracellular elastinolytic metalloproteinase
VVASTAGSLNPEALIDDTEATNWGGATSGTSVDSSHPSVTVQLAGTGTKTVHRVQVSAMLTPPPAGPLDGLPLFAGGIKATDDPDSGSRFTALRKFAIETCANACTTASSWKRIYTSADNAFPSTLPRPVAPDLTLRSFDVPDTAASQVRLVALENQCSGTPAYAGEQDNDPTNDTDCKSASDRDEIVHAAELEVY